MSRYTSKTPLRRPREMPIGIFDSGIGGLTVLREVHRLMPEEDLIYLGDTARVPYGNKSPTTVVRFACEDTQFLIRQKVKAVIVACNTASAWALDELQRRFAVPVFGVILPGAAAALEVSRNRRIGVIGTYATVRSQAYSRAILARCDGAHVYTCACPLLVPLVEEGWLKHSATDQILAEYLRPLLRRRIDTLVLGCTHYPLLRPALKKVVGSKVALVDSAESCARFVRERLAVLNLCRPDRRHRGQLELFVTDEVARFGELAGHFLGQKTGPATKVELSPLAP